MVRISKQMVNETKFYEPVPASGEWRAARGEQRGPYAGLPREVMPGSWVKIHWVGWGGREEAWSQEPGLPGVCAARGGDEALDGGDSLRSVSRDMLSSCRFLGFC